MRLKLNLNSAKKKRLGLPVPAWQSAGALLAHLGESSLPQAFPTL